MTLFLTFIGPCVANIFTENNQRDAKIHNLFISVRRYTYFGRFFRPSSEAQNCTYSVRYLSHRYCYLLLAWLCVSVVFCPVSLVLFCCDVPGC